MLKKTGLMELEGQLKSVEGKFIKKEINVDTYNCWHSDLNKKILIHKGMIEELTKDTDEVHVLLKTEIIKLTDLNYVYSSATLSQKQELIRKGFQDSLYYQKGTFRTPYMMKIFHHSIMILKETTTGNG